MHAMSTAPSTPTAFDQEFLDDLPYDPSVFPFDRLLEIDQERSLVRCRMVTAPDFPLTSAQRTHPVLHPSHVNGAIMVHATGMLGLVHAYYVLGLRHRDGWIGYGTHIHRAVFRKLVPPGTPLIGTCETTRVRDMGERRFVRYTLQFRTEAGERCYDGDQSAMWFQVDPDGPPLLELAGGSAG
jgi:hypothetical protein